MRSSWVYALLQPVAASIILILFPMAFPLARGLVFLAIMLAEPIVLGQLANRRPSDTFTANRSSLPAKPFALKAPPWQLASSMPGGKYDADHPDNSATTQGGYGASGAYPYTRLAAALGLDANAALSSASWGLGQILGMNHAAANFADAAARGKAFVASEDAQLAAVSAFIVSSKIAPAVAQKRWADHARVYDGADYAKNHYDTRLHTACAHDESVGCPDVDLRAAQVFLTYPGADTGGIDGINGPNTTAALKAFPSSIGLPVTGLPDAARLAKQFA